MNAKGKIDPTKMVRVLRSSLRDFNNDIVLVGVIDPLSLPLLKVDMTYQRLAMTAKQRKDLYRCDPQRDQFSDMELAARGSEDYETEPGGEAVGLPGPIYIIDGHQRWTTALEYRKRSGTPIFLGAAITLNTTVEFERKRFIDLSLNRRKISPSLLLRDQKEKIPFVNTLYGMTNGGDKRPMVLNERVGWGQNLGSEDLISGFQLSVLALALHNHLTPVTTTVRDIPNYMLRLETLMPLSAFRQNVATFWDALDDTWKFAEMKTHLGRKLLNIGIIKMIAEIMAEHENFWKPPQADHHLQINAEMIRRLREIKLPQLQNMVHGTGFSKTVMKNSIINWIDTGKSINKLRKRDDRRWKDAAE